MKKLLLILATLIPLAAVIAAVWIHGNIAAVWIHGNAQDEVSEVCAAIDRKDFDRVHPFVLVTGRAADSHLQLDWCRGPQRAREIHSAFRAITVHDAEGFRKRYIDEMVDAAKDSGEPWQGLQTYLTGPFLTGLDRALGMRTRVVALPCVAEWVTYDGSLGWLVVINWGITESPGCTIWGLAFAVVDPESGVVRAFQQEKGLNVRDLPPLSRQIPAPASSPAGTR